MTIPSNELLTMTAERIARLKVTKLQRFLSDYEIEHIFKTLGAFWHHPGERNIKAPHAKLTTGKHSDIYVNSPMVLCYSNLSQIMAWQLAFRLQRIYDRKIDWVTGSDSSALALSKDFANLVGARWHPMQKVKSEDGAERQIWEKMVIEPHETVLHIEELMVTSATALRVREGICAAHPDYPINFVPWLPVLTFRPSGNDTITEIEESSILPVLNYKTFVVDPEKEKCPLCAQGSQALAPKGANWQILVDSML
jgi:hypothetical protein